LQNCTCRPIVFTSSCVHFRLTPRISSRGPTRDACKTHASSRARPAWKTRYKFYDADFAHPCSFSSLQLLATTLTSGRLPSRTLSHVPERTNDRTIERTTERPNDAAHDRPSAPLSSGQWAPRQLSALDRAHPTLHSTPGRLQGARLGVDEDL
jgi:hypothetical protein